MKELVIEDPTNPSHYKAFGFESMDMMKALFGGNMKDIYAFNFLKYCLRYEFKNGLEDLDKARWYLKALIRFFYDAQKDEEECKVKSAQDLLSHNVYKGLEARNILYQIKEYIFQIELKNENLAEFLARFIELYFNKLSTDFQDYCSLNVSFSAFYNTASAELSALKIVEDFKNKQNTTKEEK